MQPRVIWKLSTLRTTSISSAMTQGGRTPASWSHAAPASVSFSVAPRIHLCHYPLLSGQSTSGRRALHLKHWMTHVYIFHAHRPNQAMQPTASPRTVSLFDD